MGIESKYLIYYHKSSELESTPLLEIVLHFLKIVLFINIYRLDCSFKLLQPRLRSVTVAFLVNLLVVM